MRGSPAARLLSQDAPIERVVDTLFSSLREAAAHVGSVDVVVAAVDVTITGGKLLFGPETIRREWFSGE